METKVIRQEERTSVYLKETEAVKGINVINHRFQDSVFSRRLLLIFGNGS